MEATRDLKAMIEGFDINVPEEKAATRETRSEKQKATEKTEGAARTQAKTMEVSPKPTRGKGTERDRTGKSSKVLSPKNGDAPLKPYVRPDLQVLPERISLYTTKRVRKAIELYRLFSGPAKHKSVSDIINEAIIEMLGEYYDLVDNDGNPNLPRTSVR